MVHTSSPPAYRLPLHIVPRHYDLNIITNLDPDNFSFQGDVWITVECIEPTDTIKVHARDLTFASDKVSVKSAVEEVLAKSVPVASTQLDTENEFFVVKTFDTLTAGQRYSLHLFFQGNLKEDLIGYYRSSYVDHTSQTTKWLSVTHFEPSEARQAFPCFDEPGMKATFTIRLAHKDSFKSVSNMPLKSTTPFEGKSGWVWDEFETTVPMSTYLIAYMVSEFDCHVAEPQPNKVEFRVWARPDALQQTAFAARVGPHFLSFYEDFYTIKYPLPKQDLLAIPDFKIGAMENWGLITFREALLLMDEKSTSSSTKLAIASVIAHELAHQWFGNLVTMHWWTDLWLKEGFATYMATLSVHHEFPDWNSLDSGAFSDLLKVFNLDSLKSSHPVSVPIGHPREISQIFDAISYDKGSFLLRMMSLFLGEEVFRHGVSQYLKNHQFGNAGQDDLWESLTEQAHRYHSLPPELTVKQIMDTWTLQTGYPLITVTRDYEHFKATISQRRYLAVKSEKEEHKGRWWVPLSYSTSRQHNFNRTQPEHWLSKDDASLVIDVGVESGEWFILNNRAAGLYRVNYDNENWGLLAAALDSPTHREIDALNRAQLITDAMDLAELGDLSYELAFRVIGYLRRETQLLPWTAGLAKLNPIKTMLSRTSSFGVFKKFLRCLLTPIVSSLGDMTVEQDTFEGSQLQNQVMAWACPLGVGDCAAQASKLFQEWYSAADPNTTNPIPKDVRRTIYSYAVKEGGEEVWEFLWQRYKKANLNTERNTIMNALTHTNEVWLLNRYLEWTLDENSGIRKQDAFIIFSAIANRDVGFFVAHKFFCKNIKRISHYYGAKSSLIGRYFSAIANQMIYPEELEELKAFAENHKELLSPASLAVSQALESVQVNINWMQNHYAHISKVLRQMTTSQM